MQSLDKTPPKEKVKYRLIYESIEQRLNQILESQKCSLKDIGHSQHDSHRSSHRDNDINENEMQNRFKTCKKVMFQPIGGGEQRNSFKRNYEKPILKSKKSIMPANVKTCKSLHCSITKGLSYTDNNNKSFRSIRTINSQLPELRKCTSQILQKLTIFFTTQITHKQVIEWLQTYCQKDRSILLKLFLRTKKVSSSRSNKKLTQQVYSLELDEDVLHAQLETRLKDGSGVERHVTLQELQELSQYLQKSFVQKMKIKTKQFQESIASKMRSMCQKIRKENDNEYILNIRKKPIEISQFLVDVNNFQNNFGSLKKINTLNRIRFKVLNDTDQLINHHVREINSESWFSKKSPSVSALT